MTVLVTGGTVFASRFCEQVRRKEFLKYIRKNIEGEQHYEDC